jgi:hypothetical protein
MGLLNIKKIDVDGNVLSDETIDVNEPEKADSSEQVKGRNKKRRSTKSDSTELQEPE